MGCASARSPGSGALADSSHTAVPVASGLTGQLTRSRIDWPLGCRKGDSYSTAIPNDLGGLLRYEVCTVVYHRCFSTRNCTLVDHTTVFRSPLFFWRAPASCTYITPYPYFHRKFCSPRRVERHGGHEPKRTRLQLQRGRKCGAAPRHSAAITITSPPHTASTTPHLHTTCLSA